MEIATSKRISLGGLLGVSLAFALIQPAHVKADDPRLEIVAQALADGIPEVALAKLKALPPSLAESPRGRTLLIESLARAGQANQALAVAAEDLNPAEVAFWRGQALMDRGQWPEAVEEFERARQAGFDDRALIGEADALRTMGNMPLALAALKAVTDEAWMDEALIRIVEIYLELGDPRAALQASRAANKTRGLPPAVRHYLEGRALLADGKPEEAAAAFRASAEGEGHAEVFATGAATVGLSLALIQLDKGEEAEAVLENFIENNPAHPSLNQMFEVLMRLYETDPDAPRPELRSWSEGPLRLRKLLAIVALARLEARAGKQERAIKRLQDLGEDYPEGPHAAAKRLLLGELLLESGRPGAALGQLMNFPEKELQAPSRAWLSFLRGRAQLQLNRFDEASQEFETAALWDQLREPSLYNAAIAAIRKGDYDLFLERYAGFSEAFPESRYRQDLVIEQGLFQARSGDVRAMETLQVFVRDFQDHPRAGEAMLALAELQFLSEPESAVAALETLGKAREQGLGGELQARADYLEFWIADAMETVSLDEVIKLGLALVNQNPNSEMIYEVRLKLGECYFRADDFVNARYQFELAAGQAKEREASDEALFLAGRAAMQIMDPEALQDALAHFTTVAEGKGPLVIEAMKRQAEVHRLLGDNAAAVEIYARLAE
ncbi:MAG: tetratricopeptide repeat protein, partial [Verrucomicrobiia bacterium]